MKRTDEEIIIEQDFEVTKEVLWKAITELEQMKKWYFENIPSFQAKVGFQTKFNIHNDGRDFMHCWTILEVIPNQLIKYNWNYTGYQGDSNVTFLISENSDGSHLKLSMKILEDFPDDIPEFKRESCVAGWNYFILDRLTKYLQEQS